MIPYPIDSVITADWTKYFGSSYSLYSIFTLTVLFGSEAPGSDAQTNPPQFRVQQQLQHQVDQQPTQQPGQHHQRPRSLQLSGETN